MTVLLIEPSDRMRVAIHASQRSVTVEHQFGDWVYLAELER